MTAELIYWDTDAFLGWFQAEKDKVELCSGTIETAESGDALIFTSALTLAEVLWLRNGPRLSKDKEAILGKFFRRSFIRVRPVTRAVAEAAQQVVWGHDVRPKDAVHVATAIDVKAGALETFDTELLARSGRINGLTIRKPAPSKAPRML